MRNKISIAIVTALSFSVALGLIAHAKDPEKTRAEKPAKTTSDATKPKIMLTKDGAVNAVMKMPEVKQFFTNVAKSKIAKPAIEMDRVEGDAYVVHVFEIVSDGPDSSHTATQNWYHVNRYTGKITKEF